MRNLSLKEDEFAKEVRVVMEERRMRTDDDPQALLYERMAATVYQVHPYHHPVIGWMSDLEALTLKDAQNWYDRWYTPNNATLVIAGDVKAEAVFALAKKYYGNISGGKVPHRRELTEPKQLGSKRLVVKAPAELPQIYMAYHAPVVRDIEQDWKPYALEVLAGVLDGNDGARLNKHLVREQQIASSAGAGYESTARGPSLFMLVATPSAGKAVSDVESALRKEIERLVTDGVSEDELKRVKAQVMAAEIFKRDSLFYQAMQIGKMESIGLGHRAVPKMLEQIQAVTAEQVQQVAAEFLHEDNLTVAVLDPQPLDKKSSQQVKGMGHGH